MSCPCGFGVSVDACCGPIIRDRSAATAEALMRSRYTAYVLEDVDYLIATHDPQTVGSVDIESTRAWAKDAQWTDLEVVKTAGGGHDDAEGMVEFIAKYIAGGATVTHHERSTFRRVEGHWAYVAGEGPEPVRASKVGRNSPCPCGSGKKHKKCCGRCP